MKLLERIEAYNMIMGQEIQNHQQINAASYTKYLPKL